MSKYQMLTQFLDEHRDDKVCMSFVSISELVEGGLPDSAFKHRPWWANRKDGSGSQNLAWQSVGWETKDVNMELDEVTFVRVSDPSPAKSATGAALSIAEAKAGLAANFGVPEDAIEIHIRG
ncbi:DUF7662 domain-containing protein [Erythrobacter litoralis]|nr:hypothetical protein [Erythrobacter litoralis]